MGSIARNPHRQRWIMTAGAWGDVYYSEADIELGRHDTVGLQSPPGELAYSTLLGGDQATAIAVDALGLHRVDMTTSHSDGAISGSGAEYINHSCDPNLIARRRQGRIFLSSLRPIAPGEELLLDSQLVGNLPIIACRCGSPRCRGYLNAPAQNT